VLVASTSPNCVHPGLVERTSPELIGASVNKIMYKEILSGAGIVLTFVMFVPYILSIRRGQTKPHVFSWVIWGLGTFVVFLAQLAAGAGSGAWPIGVSGLITIYIAAVAYRGRSDHAITKTDWIFFVVALLALPCWFLTADPLWAVVILTIVDVAGFGPTFRSAYVRPHDERMGFFALAFVRNLLVVLALEHYSVTTVLFPVAVGIGCAALVVLIAYRRRSLACLREATQRT
jgi:hypothetical protein